MFRWSNYCFLAENFSLSFCFLSLLYSTLKSCFFGGRGWSSVVVFTYSEHLACRLFKIMYYFFEWILPFQLLFNFLLFVRVFYMQPLFLKHISMLTAFYNYFYHLYSHIQLHNSSVANIVFINNLEHFIGF